jgi:hypothetical protein
MNNATTTPKMNGIISNNVSAARKSFLAAKKAFSNIYGASAGDDMTVLNNLENFINVEYCEAQIADNFKGAQGVSAACRSAIYMLEPFAADFVAEYAELSRVTSFLEMSVARELIDAQAAK